MARGANKERCCCCCCCLAAAVKRIQALDEPLAAQYEYFALHMQVLEGAQLLELRLVAVAIIVLFPNLATTTVTHDGVKLRFLIANRLVRNRNQQNKINTIKAYKEAGTAEQIQSTETKKHVRNSPSQPRR
jgi:hypothetical protein